MSNESRKPVDQNEISWLEKLHALANVAVFAVAVWKLYDGWNAGLPAEQVAREMMLPLAVTLVMLVAYLGLFPRDREGGDF